MAKNQSRFTPSQCLRPAKRAVVGGLTVLAVMSGPVSAGQVVDDEDVGSAQQQAPATSTRSGGGRLSNTRMSSRRPTDNRQNASLPTKSAELLARLSCNR